MTKRTIGIFFIISIIMDLVGIGMIIGGLAGSTYVTTNNGYSTSAQVTHFGNQTLFILGIIFVSLSAIPFLIAWIGALVNLARLQAWVWFILMIIFSWITLLIYLIAGPTRPRAQQYAQYMPPQQPQYNSQQPQNYPQQPYYNTQQPQGYPEQQYNPQQPQYNPEQAQNYPQQPQYNPQQPQGYPQQSQYNPQQPQNYPQQSQDYLQHPQNNPQPPQDNPQS